MNADALLHWLLRTSFEVSVLILVVIGLRLMLGARLSPAWRIGLWMLVGMKLMLPAFIPAGFGLGSWIRQETADVRAVIQASSPPEQTSFLSFSTVSLPDATVEHSWSFSLQILLANVWLIGSAAVLLSAFFRQRRFDRYLLTRRTANDPHLRSTLRSLCNRARVSMPMVRLMPAGTTPALVGIRQPQILLPEDWQARFDQRSLRHVLLHELLHVKQSDLLWNWAATAVQALHWFNPLVWFVVSRFQADRELRCDAGALAILSPAERLDYGHTLLRIQETFFAPPTIAGLAPCVRHHPTLRQRILMIATPTTRQPVIQALLVLTLSVLVGYSFTTARAAEKEVPPKVREGSTTQKPSTESPKPAMRESDAGTPARKGDRESGKPNAERDGEKSRRGEADQVTTSEKKIFRFSQNGKIAAIVDGYVITQSEVDAVVAKSSGSISEKEALESLIQQQIGKKQRTHDGEGNKKPGMRDGERPRTGERDGEKPRTGERRKPSAESSSKPRKGDGDRETTSSGEVLTLKVIDGGDTVLIGDEKVPMNRLRGFLSTFLPDHPGARVEVTGNDDTPLKALHNTVDAVRDNGNKNVGIKAE